MRNSEHSLKLLPTGDLVAGWTVITTPLLDRMSITSCVEHDLVLFTLGVSGGEAVVFIQREIRRLFADNSDCDIETGVGFNTFHWFGEREKRATFYKQRNLSDAIGGFGEFSTRDFCVGPEIIPVAGR